MKRLLTTALLATAVAFAAPAMAQDINWQGFYVGGSIGATDFSIDECIGDCDKTDIGFKAFAGYMFNPYIGTEFSWQSFGKAKVNVGLGSTSVNAEAKSSGFGAFLVGQYPIENWRIFGKLGVGWLDNEVEVTVPTLGAASESDSSTEFAWGLGVTYMFTKNLGIRGEYENFKYSFQDVSDNITMWSIGVQYNF
jgi:OOP family OmpA-OmpF porin